MAGAAEAVEASTGRWPLATDLNRATIHKVTLDLLAPGPHRTQPLYVLSEDTPFAYERIAAAFGLLIDADRYAKGNNPARDHELLASGIVRRRTPAVTAHRTHQPYPWPPR